MTDPPRPLAALGSPPAFAEPLHVGRPTVGDRAASLAVLESILARQWFTNDGPCVADPEQHLARRIGVRHCATVSNGTTEISLLAAHAFGCDDDHGRQVGSAGTAEVFSFHATKVFHTFEGGTVTTDRDDLAAELRLLRNFGFRVTDDVVIASARALAREIWVSLEFGRDTVADGR